VKGDRELGAEDGASARDRGVGACWWAAVVREDGPESRRSQLIQRGSKEVHAIRATGCVANADPVTGERELTERSWWRV
jgi:hypothetical protein